MNLKLNREYFKDRNSRPEGMPEQILCAAIWYHELETPVHRPKNTDKGLVISGHRHHQCISIVASTLGKRTVTFGPDSIGEHTQGFLTNKNRFVNREEAAKIAVAAGQCLEGITELFSEDLY